MDETLSLEDSSMTVVQTDSTIAFAYIKEVKSRKKRFFVLKSLPPNYFLYAYKSKKHYERCNAKRIYDLCNVILLSRCTKKANKTILGVSFEDEALFLKFDTEDELNRWYFHLNEIFSAKRNCLWPELKQCFSVTLKNKDLASAGARHGKANLPGQYRFCLTESAVLLVSKDLLNPALSLPFPCIRSCVHSVTSNFFQIHLGRLSPIGEGVLHFEAEESSLLKEIIENLLRCLSEASSRDVEFVKARKSRRNSREAFTAAAAASQQREDYAPRPVLPSQSCCLRPAHTSSIVGLGFLTADAAGRGLSLPPPDSLSQPDEDYCPMELGGGEHLIRPIAGGGAGGGDGIFHSRSPNSSMSLSTGSELTGAESDRALSVTVAAFDAAVQPPKQQQQQPSSNNGVSPHSQRLGQPTDDRARVARVATWRYDGGNGGSGPSPQSTTTTLLSAAGSPVIRANSIGSRPSSSAVVHKSGGGGGGSGGSFPMVHNHQHIYYPTVASARGAFANAADGPRPRTISDAASLHYMSRYDAHGTSANSNNLLTGTTSSAYASSSSGRSFRPRARSYGTKFGRSLDASAATHADSPAYSASAAPGGLRPLSESASAASNAACAANSANYSLTSSCEHHPQQRSTLPASSDEGSYVTMVLRPTPDSNNGFAGLNHDGNEEEEEFDPYWTPPGRLDALVARRTYGGGGECVGNAGGGIGGDAGASTKAGDTDASSAAADYLMVDLPAS